MRGVALLVLFVVAGGLPPSAAASTRSDTAAKTARQRQIGEQLATLKNQVAEVSVQEAALLGELDSLDGRIAALSSQVGALDGRILVAQSELTGAEIRLDQLEGRFREADARLQNLRRRVHDARVELRSRAVAAYVEGPVLEAYADAFLISGVREIAARGGYLDRVVANQHAALDDYRVLRDRAADQADALDVARSLAVDQRDVVAQQTAALSAARRDQDALRQEVLSQQNRRADVLEEVRSRKLEFEKEIAALRAESNAIAALLRARQAGQGIQPSGRGVLAVPIPGAPITSTFGPRRHPIFGDIRQHNGIDFRAGTGRSIVAAADGEVVFAGRRGGYGNATIIDHGRSLATLYAHQSVILVRAGQRVRRGQLIGRVGSTGFSTGPHLHFEVRVAGTPVNPLRYL